jgi:hypothetical protein
MEDTMNDIGLKWEEDKKRQWELRERNSLDEETEDDISARNMDCGQLNKHKTPSLDALEHHVKRKERQVGKALKTWVKLT